MSVDFKYYATRINRHVMSVDSDFEINRKKFESTDNSVSVQCCSVLVSVVQCWSVLVSVGQCHWRVLVSVGQSGVARF